MGRKEGEWGRGGDRGRKVAAVLDAGAPPPEPRPSAQRRDASSMPRTRGVGGSGQKGGLRTGTEPKTLRAGLTCPLKSLWAVM